MAAPRGHYKIFLLALLDRKSRLFSVIDFLRLSMTSVLTMVIHIDRLNAAAMNNLIGICVIFYPNTTRFEHIIAQFLTNVPLQIN